MDFIVPLRHCRRPIYSYIDWCGSLLNRLFSPKNDSWFLIHSSDVIWRMSRLKCSPACSKQQQNIKALHYWLLIRETTGAGWISYTIRHWCGIPFTSWHFNYITNKLVITRFNVLAYLVVRTLKGMVLIASSIFLQVTSKSILLSDVWFEMINHNYSTTKLLTT